VDALPTGRLFGWVEIVDCKTQKDAQGWPWADRGSSTERFCWKIGRVYKLVQPIAIKGGQGRWYLPKEKQDLLLQFGKLQI